MLPNIMTMWMFENANIHFEYSVKSKGRKYTYQGKRSSLSMLGIMFPSGITDGNIKNRALAGVLMAMG